ncbi:MAG TPA: rRNA maturation RNase YbeY [Stellaceae bacterium]|nr:rRNA maturation RNase YbeY [Stellaceae bacterium]
MTLAGAPTVNVVVSASGWVQALPDAAALAEGAAQAALRQGGAPPPAVVDVTLTDDAEQRALNQTWRGKDAPTNVLAFPAADPSIPVPDGAPLLLGDVVLAFETVHREAGEQEKPLADHLRHLVVHGALHLLGHDHENAAEAAIMEAREIAILAEMGVPNPYRDTI